MITAVGNDAPPRNAARFLRRSGRAERRFLVWDDGYRTHHRTYAEVARAARDFAAKLRAQAIGKGEKVVFWSENRPEWVAALWGCLLEGVIAVPIDFRSSADFVKRIAGIVEARAILAGDSVDASAGDCRSSLAVF